MIRIDVQIKKSDVITSVEQYAWQAGQNIWSANGAPQMAANVQCGDQERDVIEGFLVSAVADAERILSRVLVDDKAVADDSVLVPDVLVFLLELPDTFALRQEEVIKSFIYDYLVYHVLTDWFKSVKLADEITICTEHQNAAERGLIESINKRNRPVRRNAGRRWG